MAGIGPILDYKSVQLAQRELTLEEAGGCVTVNFGVFPKWVYVFPIVVWLMMGLCFVMAAFVGTYMIWKFSHAMVRPTAEVAALAHRLEIQQIPIFLVYGGAGFGALILAAFQWVSYHRWGRVPVVLTASKDGLVRSHLGFGRMRERNWPASEFIRIEFRILKGNLNWKRTAAILIFRRSKGRRLRYQLSSSEPQLPRRIAERLATALGCPLL